MTLTIHIGYLDEGKMTNLFYYNPQTNKIEYMESSKINSAGNAKFVFTHASDYAIIIFDEAISDFNTTETSNPKTGESDILRIISIFAVLSAAAILFINKISYFKVVKKTK